MSHPIVPAPDHTFFRGRYALQAVLESMDVGPGHSVAIQAFTCSAVPIPIISLGATPVYVDVDVTTLSMDPEDLVEKVDESTAAIVIQHTFGIPGPIYEVLSCARSHGVPVIEDCCHGAASIYQGKVIGSYGAAAFFSYEWGKPLVAGVGGGLKVRQESLQQDLVDKASGLAEPPLGKKALIEAQYLAFTRLFPRIGYWKLKNAYQYLSSLGLVVGTFQGDGAHVEPNPEADWTMAPASERRLHRLLRSATELTVHQKDIRAHYDHCLAEAGLNSWIEYRPGVEATLLRYPLRTTEKRTLVDEARRAGVEVSDIFATPVHPLSDVEWPALGYEAGSCPRAELLARELVSLPIHHRVGRDDVEKVTAFLYRHRELLSTVSWKDSGL